MGLWCYSLESTDMPGKIVFQVDCPFSELPLGAREDGKWCLQEAFASKRELQSLKHRET